MIIRLRRGFAGSDGKAISVALIAGRGISLCRLTRKCVSGAAGAAGSFP